MSAAQEERQAQLVTALKLLKDRLGDDGLWALQLVVEAQSYASQAQLVEMVRRGEL